MNFYNRFYKLLTSHLFAIMPFDAIVLKHHFEGLCIPGLGTRRYADMSRALMDFLLWLIQGTLSSRINATLAAIRCKTNNGYDYLWCILELMVPGFDPIIPILTPQWHESEDIFHFSQSYLLYFRFQSKMHYHYTDRVWSSTFLRAIQNSDYADTVTTLQSHVNSYCEDYDTGFLPPHLRLHRLAESIHSNAQACLQDIVSPRLRRIDYGCSMVRGYHRLPLIHHLSTVLAAQIILNRMELASATTTAMAMATATQGAYANASRRAGTLPRVVLMRVPRLTDHAPRGAVLLPGPTATDARSSRTFNVWPVRGLATLPNIATCLQRQYVLNGT